jgi:DNA-binding GntR family transcriptional regulator
MQAHMGAFLSARNLLVNLPFMLACKKLWGIVLGCNGAFRDPMMLGVGDNPRVKPKSSLVDDAYRALKEAIRENAFPPGYQGSELEIAQKLGMSRTPVHEAVIRLQEEGLVRVLPRRGVVVCSISPDDIREIYDVIIALESAAAELLASKPRSERIKIAAELESANVEMQNALDADDLTTWAKGDEVFHRLLVERCGNQRLARMLSTIMDQSHRARILTLRLRPKPIDSVPQHRRIVEAIKEGDVASAREFTKVHRTTARDLVVPLLTQYGMKFL